ncbi:phage major capsid protein [Yinghuangia aomiensis]
MRYEEYKAVLADDTLTDAEKQERTAKLDQAPDDKAEEVRGLIARADEETEQRAAMERFGSLFTAKGTEDPEDQAEDMRSILVAVANGERRDVLVMPETRAPGGNVSPNAGKTSDPAWAGNTTAVQFIAQVLESMRERSPFLSLVDTFSTSNGEVVRYPVKNLRPLPTDVGAAMPEGEKYTFVKGGFGTVDLGAKKYGVASQLSIELMQDSEVDIVGIVANDIGEAVADEGHARHVGQDADARTGRQEDGSAHGPWGRTFDQLVDVEHNLRTGYRRNAAWLMGDKQLAEVRKIKDSTGMPIWQPSVTLGRPDSPAWVPGHY